MRVLIAGAGIGGLATALALEKVGIKDVTVLESVNELKPLGVGINVLPHAVRELDELNLLADLDKIAVRTSDLTYVNVFGQTIWREPRGMSAGYNWPQYSVHRGQLQMLLLGKVQERLGHDSVVTGAKLLSERSENESVRVVTTAGEFDGDLLVAADGIHSSVRASWHPAEGEPIWNGAVLWRSTSRSKPFLSGRSMVMAGHKLLKFVAYPISLPAEDGLQEINWIAEQVQDNSVGFLTDWNREIESSKFAHLFSDWTFDWLDIPGLIRSSNRIYEYPMVDRDPLQSWIRGRTVLLGDAAHPTYPIGSNGSSQAIIDAMTLAEQLAQKPIYEALRQYEAERLPKTRGLQAANREMGPEVVMQLSHDRAPNGFDDIESVISFSELESVATKYKMVAGLNPDALNVLPARNARYKS